MRTILYIFIFYIAMHVWKDMMKDEARWMSW